MVENKKAKLLNSKAAMEGSKSKEVIAALRLRKGMRVSDIGVGGGYFALLLAGAVGQKGRVYIADTDQKMLDYSLELAKKQGMRNIMPVLVREGILDIPKQKIDLVFMRSVCHHLKNRAEYFRLLRTLLKPGGRVALIDYHKGGFFAFRWLRGHYVEKDVVKEEMEKAGFKLGDDFCFIPRQWFMVFTVK